MFSWRILLPTLILFVVGTGGYLILKQNTENLGPESSWYQRARSFAKKYPKLTGTAATIATVFTTLFAYKKMGKSEVRAPSAEVASVQGKRRTMEDQHLISYPLYAVFDGHGGDKAAQYAAENFGGIFKNQLSKHKDDITTALLGAVQELDKQFLTKAETEELKDGTTAIICYLTQDKIWIANVGDSRAILCDNKGAVVPLSTDQSVSNLDDHSAEKKRLQSIAGSNDLFFKDTQDNILGGIVGEYLKLSSGKGVAVTRAIGDKLFKDQLKDIFISTPEIEDYDRSQKPQFLVLACDGLWDVLENQEVIDFIKTKRSHGTPLKQIVDELVQHALDKGSSDNITAIIITFD